MTLVLQVVATALVTFAWWRWLRGDAKESDNLKAWCHVWAWLAGWPLVLLAIWRVC